MELIDKYNKFKELFEAKKKEFGKILDTYKGSPEKLENGQFEEDEKDVIAKANYALGEMNKIMQIAIFADYFELDGYNTEGFSEVPNYNVILESLRVPLIVYDENTETFNINNEEDWKKYTEVEIEKFKEHQKAVNKILDGDI